MNAHKFKLIEIYRKYGFELSKEYVHDQVLVFTIKTGYFHNADIVKLRPESNADNAFGDFSKVGYACTIRQASTPEQVEGLLFKGFFSIDSILSRLKGDYERFAKNIVEPFSNTAIYKYVNAPYQINSRPGELDPATEIISKLQERKPALFLVEAAAGFGKTCTAYELLKLIIDKNEFLPLFSELSRYRQSVIFRHVLLEEIDRSFPGLSSRLVQAEMKTGRVITILDGFDELLRKNEDGTDFENKEPMLETIGELLTGSAKIILTTRRTVLFEGDAFHTWVERHADEFDFIRIRINEPQVSNWLPENRIKMLRECNLNIENIANPVLLSYLRFITDEDFEKAAQAPHLLVEKYFEFMLDREKTRQDLHIDSETQQVILCSVAQDMIDLGYTSEQRDYIVDLIQSENSKALDNALLSYPASSRPSKEEIANKLASHALLDRSRREPNKIGFINEFVFGHFIGKNILSSTEWLNDDLRFIEPAAISYQPRSQSAKDALWDKLLPSMEYLPISDQIVTDIRLKGEIGFALRSDEAQGLEITAICIGMHPISDFQFNECVFRNCTFNPENFSNVTFLNCRFFDNSINPDYQGGSHTSVFILGGSGDQQFIDDLIAQNNIEAIEDQPDRQTEMERFILEKFWPVGRDTISFKHRPIKGVCANSGDFRTPDLYRTIASLKRRNILLEPKQPSFIEINFEEINSIKSILGRDG